MSDFTITTHDDYPPRETAVIDRGIGDANNAAAPLDEVRAVCCYARLNAPAEQQQAVVIRGAVGRRWGECCELQQLWVDPAHRRQGLGGQLLAAFEQHARDRGCTSVYLETFSFQAPEFYAARGYEPEYVRRGFPHGIEKHHLVKRIR